MNSTLVRLTGFCNSAHIHHIHHLSPVLWQCVCLDQHWVPSTWQGGLGGNSHSILRAEWRHKQFTYQMTHAEWESDMWKRWGIYGLKEEKGPWAKGVTLCRSWLSLRAPPACHLISRPDVYTMCFLGHQHHQVPYILKQRKKLFSIFEEKDKQNGLENFSKKNQKESIQQQKTLKILAWSLVSQWNSRKHFQAPCPSWNFKRAPTDSLLLVFMLFCSTSWVTSDLMGKGDIWIFQYGFLTQHKHLYFF